MTEANGMKLKIAISTGNKTINCESERRMR
jgi:hypothetical protein